MFLRDETFQFPVVRIYLVIGQCCYTPLRSERSVYRLAAVDTEIYIDSLEIYVHILTEKDFLYRHIQSDV
jgi:hypothetical protein